MAVVMRKFLLFEAGGRSFGLRIGDVERVVHAVRPAPLPHGPAAIAGVFNLQGTAVPVIDVGVWCGELAKEVRLDDLFVVVRAHGRCVALHVESAQGVIEIPDTSIQPAGSAMMPAAHFHGVAMLERGVVFLPDVENFLAAAKTAQAFDQATAA